MADYLFRRMRSEMKGRGVFRQAQAYAFDYVDGLETRPVYPSPDAIEGLRAFDEDLPEAPSDAAEVLHRLHESGSPATVAQLGGRYFGFVNGGAVPAALAARWLADIWDQNAALGVMSPTAAKLETVVERWLRQLLGLPDETVAGFVGGSSMAILCGLAAGRHHLLQRLGWDVNRQGLGGAPALRLVTGRQIHGSVLKALSLLGLGTESIEWVECDDQGRLMIDALPALDDRTLLILQAGNVNSGAFDPIEEICLAARAAGSWVHVDGAFGLWAAAARRLEHLCRGIGLADSWSADGHKTLNTPYDNGIVLCRDKEALIGALQATGAYLAFSETRDGMLHTPDMSRRARAVDLWATLKYLGRQGVDDLVTGLHRNAVQMSKALERSGFRVLNDVVFNQVLVACKNDDMTTQTLQNVQASGECWAGGTLWKEHPAIRVSICSWATDAEDIKRAAKAFSKARNQALKTTGKSKKK